MIKTYAVAFMNFDDNLLDIRIVKTPGSWKEALLMSKFIDGETADTLDDSIETAQEQAFDQDWMFDVKEVN
jgi:diacylglycerol kinase family enzyme